MQERTGGYRERETQRTEAVTETSRETQRETIDTERHT